MLSTEEFKAFAKGVVPFLHVTSYVKGAAYPDLLSEKGGAGFPHVVAMNAAGSVTAEMDWDKIFTLDGMTDLVAHAKSYAEKKANPELPGDEWVDLLRFDLKFGNLAVEEYRKQAAGREGLTEAQKKKLDGAVLDREIPDLLPKSRDPEAARAAGKTFAGMHRAGREPVDDQPYQYFYILILEHAEAEKDAKLFEEALSMLRKRFGDKPQAAPFFQKQEARLEKLKEEAAAPKEEPGAEPGENPEDE